MGRKKSIEDAAATSDIPASDESAVVKKGLNESPELDSLTGLNERLAALSESMKLTDEKRKLIDPLDKEALTAHEKLVRDEMMEAKNLSDSVSDLAISQKRKIPQDSSFSRLQAGSAALDAAWKLMSKLLEMLVQIVKQRTFLPQLAQKEGQQEGYKIGIPVGSPFSTNGRMKGGMNFGQGKPKQVPLGTEIDQARLVQDLEHTLNVASEREKSLKLESDSKDSEQGLDNEQSLKK